MDILEQFLNNISYKFPKGYPDMSNPKDAELLFEEFKKIGIDLKELKKNKDHWDNRVKERGNILDIINFPNDSPISKQDVIKQIEDELLIRASKLEKLEKFPISLSYNIGYKFFKPLLNYKEKNIPLELKVKYITNEVEKIGIGIAYVALIWNDTLITLLLVKDDSDIDVEKQLKNHQEYKQRNNPNRVLTSSNYEFIISQKIDNKSNIIDINNLPYKPRTDYRKGANFEHNIYGKGIIVNSSAGSGGKGDSKGKLDWIEVKFEKPYVSGGQLKQTRILNNIYTLTSLNLNI